MALVFLGPEITSVSRIHQLHVNAQQVSLPAQAALDRGINFQLGTDAANVTSAPLKCEGAGPRHDLEAGNTSECGDQLVGETVRKVFVVRVAARASEREYYHAPYERGRCFWFRPDELWGVAPLGKKDPPAFARTFTFVILFQLFP